MQGVMDRKKQKTTTPIWKPVCTKSSTAQECSVKKLQIECEDLHEVDDTEKLEGGSQVHEEVASASRSLEGGSVPSHEKHSISLEEVKSPNEDYSHFISLPLAINPELVDKLVNCQRSILGISDPNEHENLDSDSNGDTSEDEFNDRKLDRGPDFAIKLNVEDDKIVKVATNMHRVSYPPKVSIASEPSASKPSTLSGMHERFTGKSTCSVCSC